MTDFDYRHWSHKASDWSADYRENIAQRPVRASVQPGDVLSELAISPPEHGESMETIFSDFERIIPDAMTHWQHPRFFAYFQSNAAPAAQIGDQLANSMAAQCMLWQTSPAATELELRMVDWLRQSVGLPDSFSGSFQDGASASTLCAILVMRERSLNFTGNEQGLFNQKPLRIYASEQNHSSIEKSLWISGLGSDNLVKIPTTGTTYSMDEQALQSAITSDRANGFCPSGIVICVGGTGIGAIDNVENICAIAKQENLYTHVDAAWAGSAMICPEFRHLWQGIERADSIVINPHKWLGVPLECSLHLVRDPRDLSRVLAIRPDYLQKTDGSQDINLSEWSPALGRRFRALKVWFLLRSHGLEDLRSRIRNHIQWSSELADRLSQEPDFEIVTPPILSLFSFRHLPSPPEAGDIDSHNLRLVQAINDDGRIYLTQASHDNKTMIRFVAGQFDMRKSDIDIAFDTITSLARSL